VTPDHREQQETSPQRRRDADDVDDDADKDKPESEAVAVSWVDSKTPRDKVAVEQLKAQLPDRSDGSRSARPGLVTRAS